MKKILKTISLLGFAWLLVHSIIVLFIGLKPSEKTTKYGVVLGNTVHEDGSLSKRLKARLDASLDAYNKQQVQYIITSGGLGKEGHYEAEVMALYLQENGIPKNRILIDNEGNNTHLSAVNCKNRLEDEQEIMIFTQYHHILRCKLAFKQCGFAQVYGYAPSYFETKDFVAILREFAAYYSYWFKY